MNKIIYLIIFIISLNNCSFDNKTGIWTGSNQIVKKKIESDNSNLKLIFTKQNNNIKDKDLAPNKVLKIENPKLYTEWSQSYQNKFNFLGNVSFLNKGNYKKHSKISKAEVNKNILVYKNNIFFSDIKGNIGIFSISQNQLIYKFNFYKKKMKKTKKDIKLIVKDDILIAADNFGYIYSIDYKKKKLIWAKNYLIPFRSNLKIVGKILFLSNEKNKIILINTVDGNQIDEFYTQPSKTVSEFQSNLALDNKDNLLFLSTNGSLYSLNLINQKTINWIQNFKDESDIAFNAKPIIVSGDKIIVSSDNNISLLEVNGAKVWELNIKSEISPISSGNTIFTINKENYLILIDKNSGQIIYSKSLYSLIERDFKKNFKRKIEKINNIYITDNKLLLIANNSYFVEINLEKIINISSIKKNPFKIMSDIIFLKNEIIFVSSSNRVYKVN